MPMPLRVRTLSYEEEYRLRYHVRGQDIFALRRAQIVLGSAQGQSGQSLSRQVGCSAQNMRLLIQPSTIRDLPV
ncbi:hypothetical protein IAD21_05615 [Abditibacteriota bacterium]|nr:hypothetical protein IAD21_05615 [Abditibacteriota bacterium]